MDFGPTTQQLDETLTRDALPSGTRLGGYQIIDVLGRGGFGIVYLALDSSLQRQVAIKEYFPTDMAVRCDDHQVWVKPGADANSYALGKTGFLNEAKLLARFDHPALCRVHSFWEENRSAYMVMPYYDGHTLTSTLRAMPRPPDEAWLRALLTPLLSALGALHTAQFLHLDVSPDNILVLSDGRPVLLDFGVANRLVSDKTLPLTALLNPAYAPIEQYGESATLPQGPWTDIYALAGVLHFAITGVPPARATVRAVEDPQRPLAETVRALNKRFPGLQYSESFLAGIDKALSVKPRDRPRDVADFQHLLNHPPLDIDPLLGAAASDFQATDAGARSEPAFEAPPREEWISADPSAHASGPTRRRTSLWVAVLFTVALAGVIGWAWMQRQPAQADITSADLPANTAIAPAASAPNAAEAAASSAVDSAAAALAVPPMASAPEVSASAPVTAAASVAPVASMPAEPTPAPAPPPAPVAEAPKPAAAPPAAPAPPAPAPAPAAAPPKKAAAKAVAEAPEANNPRAMCGSRTNFSLVYCMQTQCNRPVFAKHAQCIDMRRRGEID
jgi:serine/threonine protein kinase